MSNDSGGSNSGHVRIYKWNGSAWTQLGGEIIGELAEDTSGESISISNDGTVIAIGASQNDGNGSSQGMLGFMYLMELHGYKEVQILMVKLLETFQENQFRLTVMEQLLL